MNPLKNYLSNLLIQFNFFGSDRNSGEHCSSHRTTHSYLNLKLAQGCHEHVISSVQIAYRRSGFKLSWLTIGKLTQHLIDT